MLARMWQSRIPCSLLVGMQISTTLLKAVWRFLKNLNIQMPFDTMMPLLDIYPKECKTGYNRDTCTLLFITALFTIAKFRDNSHALRLKNGWIQKMWYIYIQ
jgi:hypothetical protein